MYNYHNYVLLVINSIKHTVFDKCMLSNFYKIGKENPFVSTCHRNHP